MEDTVTDMDMDTGQNSTTVPRTRPSQLLARVAGACNGLLLMGLASSSVMAQGWGFRPHVSLTGVYTDNVNLSPSGQEDSDLILVGTPGFSLLRETSRLKLEAVYDLQMLAFVDDSSANRVNHELDGNMNAELQPDFLFLDATARMTEVNVDSRAPRAVDNITGSVNRTDVQAYSISPYIHHDMAGYATALLRYGFEWVDTDGAVGRSESNFIDAGLNSGRRSGFLSWNLNYFKRQDDRTGTYDIDQERITASLAYQLHPTLSLVAEGGREDNAFGSTEVAQNGSYWGAGATWTPNRYLSMTAMEGDRFSSASVSLTPSQRTSLLVSYRERDVGFNPGAVWHGRFQHTTRRSVWQLTYLEDTQTTQRLLLTGPVWEIRDSTGRVLERFAPPSSFSLTDELFERKRAQGSVSYQTGKSTVALAVYRERRDILLGTVLGEESAHGGLAEWQWQFSGHTQAIIKGNWERIDFRDVNREDDYWYLDMMLTRTLSRLTSASVGYRHARNDSSLDRAEYTENRIYATFRVEY